MVGGGNQWINEEEQEKHGGGSLNNSSSGGDHHGYYDPPTSFNNGAGLVSALGHESFHHQPPWNQVNLNPQKRGPLGLSLRKSKSLVNLIETTLTQEKMSGREEFHSQPSFKKLKATNFPAICLQIGSWNWVSKNEGDLVAKLYYSKKKVVWEFLFGPLKRKMEICWCEISAINAFISKGENGRLEIELNEPPQFGQEINSQPGKHTRWTTMTDFTGNQALICRRHKVEFLPGVLDKHLKNLLECDHRLRHLSQQPFPIHNSPYFPNTFINFSNSAGSSLVPVGNFQIQEQEHVLPESMILHPQPESYIQNLVQSSDPEQQEEGNYNQINSDNGGNGINQLGYSMDNEIVLEEPNFWLPFEVSIDDIDINDSSVMNHVGYVDESGINGGVPSSWLVPAQVNTNYQDQHVHPRMGGYGTQDSNQNYKP